MLFGNDDFVSALNSFDFDMHALMKETKNDTIKEHHRFFTAKEGLLRGNMFKYEYQPYKNLTYLPLIPTSEKEALLFKVYEYDFALNDLSLYLDLHPEDREAFEMFKGCVKEFELAKDAFERLYGPMELTDSTGVTYDWLENPWPWDKDRGAMYV